MSSEDTIPHMETVPQRCLPAQMSHLRTMSHKLIVKGARMFSLYSSFGLILLLTNTENNNSVF